jgi:hypothetical protein
LAAVEISRQPSSILMPACPELGGDVERDLIPGIDASVGDGEPYDDHVILGKDGDQL